MSVFVASSFSGGVETESCTAAVEKTLDSFWTLLGIFIRKLIKFISEGTLRHNYLFQLGFCHIHIFLPAFLTKCSILQLFP